MRNLGVLRACAAAAALSAGASALAHNFCICLGLQVSIGANWYICMGYNQLGEEEEGQYWRATGMFPCYQQGGTVDCPTAGVCCAPYKRKGYFTCDNFINGDCGVELVCGSMCCVFSPYIVRATEICGQDTVVYFYYDCDGPAS